MQNKRVIAVMPMDVEVYKVSAGGVRELVDGFSAEANVNIKSAVNEIIRDKRKYQLKYFPEPQNIKDAKTKQLVKDTAVLFNTVDFSIFLHTYKNASMLHPMQGVFEDKLKNFDYSLGSQVFPLSAYADADLLLFIKGGDSLSSGGRIALMVWAALMGFTPASAGPPHLSCALVDPETGDILWYNFLCPGEGYNFRNKKSVEQFVSILLKDFP
ncbi:MAG: hypothetical protein ABIH18_08440 [Candidatus Omnitrophota bacterium]